MIAVEKDTRLPVTIVTGFLGSGKTAFLRRSLDGGRLSDALIVVNEAAPYGVDDKLLRDNASGVALLANGCICCRIDKGMKEELHRILALNGRSLHFKSVVIELSGLADPVAVIATIASDPYLNGQMRIALVVALADCLHAADSDREQPEHRRQLEAADIVLLSKTDLATIEKRRATERLAADAAPLAPCLDGRELRLDNLQAHAAGLEVHAGHGLSFDTVGAFAAMPELRELNIGHFLVSEAVFMGLGPAITEMRRLMDDARG